MPYYISCSNDSGRFYGWNCESFEDLEDAINLVDSEILSGRATSAEVVDRNDDTVYANWA